MNLLSFLVSDLKRAVIFVKIDLHKIWLAAVCNLKQDLHSDKNVPDLDSFVDMKAVNSDPDNLILHNVKGFEHFGFCMNFD
jgi:hypothetical protein